MTMKRVILWRAPCEPFNDEPFACLDSPRCVVNRAIERGSAHAFVGQPIFCDRQNRTAGLRSQKFVNVEKEKTVREESSGLNCLSDEAQLKVGLVTPVEPKHDLTLMQVVQHL